MRIIGIAGASGSGKSTLAQRLVGEMGAQVIKLDDFMLDRAHMLASIVPGLGRRQGWLTVELDPDHTGLSEASTAMMPDAVFERVKGLL